jgi:hypothetical protein
MWALIASFKTSRYWSASASLGSPLGGRGSLTSIGSISDVMRSEPARLLKLLQGTSYTFLQVLLSSTDDVTSIELLLLLPFARVFVETSDRFQ